MFNLNWPNFPKQAQHTNQQTLRLSPDTARVISAIQQGYRSQIIPMPPPLLRTIKPRR